VKQRHLVVYDYGMGGIWLHIHAESAEQIERRWPSLKVVRPGDPDWLTPERFREAENWPGPEMEFDINQPTGWLADSDVDLRQPPPEDVPGHEHTLPDGRVIRVWFDVDADEPQWLCFLDDADGNELRYLAGWPLAPCVADLLGYDTASDEWPDWIDRWAEQVVADTQGAS
jgi:hypothetical protein